MEVMEAVEVTNLMLRDVSTDRASRMGLEGGFHRFHASTRTKPLRALNFQWKRRMEGMEATPRPSDGPTRHLHVIKAGVGERV